MWHNLHANARKNFYQSVKRTLVSGQVKHRIVKCFKGLASAII